MGSRDTYPAPLVLSGAESFGRIKNEQRKDKLMPAFRLTRTIHTPRTLPLNLRGRVDPDHDPQFGIHRIRRNIPVTLTEEQFLKYATKIEAYVLAGMVVSEVQAEDGSWVTMSPDGTPAQLEVEIKSEGTDAGVQADPGVPAGDDGQVAAPAGEPAAPEAPTSETPVTPSIFDMMAEAVVEEIPQVEDQAALGDEPPGITAPEPQAEPTKRRGGRPKNKE